MRPRRLCVLGRLVVVPLLALAASVGCALPLEVRRVADPSSPVRGVRFLVRRPAYQAALALDESAGRTCRFRLVLTQTLDGPPILYEAVVRPGPLASAELELVLAPDGALAAVSAGETDRTREVVAAVAELATSFAPVAARGGRPAPPPVCTGLPEEARASLGAYVAAHRALVAHHARVREAIEQQLAALTPEVGSAQLRSIDALRAFAGRLEQEIDAHRFPLAPGSFEVRLRADDGTTLVPVHDAAQDGGLGPWFILTLSAEASS